MSGIAGIMRLDGQPVDLGLIDKMTNAIRHRGPDGTHHWVRGSVALGHCVLRDSIESYDESQPCTLDGEVWITADARIDRRVELIRTLRAAQHPVQNEATDAQLLLHAYDAFGEALLERLIGDFAFALWDSRSKKLICARDHFGVRPFFYARTRRAFLFASDIDSILAYGGVSEELDEDAIGDFLLFGEFQKPDLSIYRNIRRLPAGNFICVEQEGIRLRQYWELPLRSTIRWKSCSYYVDQFREVFGEAVNDRIRSNRVAVELSGGMDSGSVAAIARTDDRLVTAYTATCQGLSPDDEEGHYAGMTASHLSIPIYYQAYDNYALFERFDDPQLRTSEPYSSADKAVHFDRLNQVKDNGARVLLTGQGGDALFMEPSMYYAELLSTGRIARLLLSASRRLCSTGSLRGTGLRSALMPWRRQPGSRVFPDWIDGDFAHRTRLRERWDEFWTTVHDADTGGTYAQLRAPWVSSIFEGYEKLKIPVVARHPFFDVRLAQFMRSLPHDIRFEKLVLREAMRGKLPEQVRVRPKAGPRGDLVRTRFARGHTRVPRGSGIARVGMAYVDGVQYKRAVESYVGGEGPQSVWSSYHMVSPVVLDRWLVQRDDPST